MERRMFLLALLAPVLHQRRRCVNVAIHNECSERAADPVDDRYQIRVSRRGNYIYTMTWVERV